LPDPEPLEGSGSFLKTGKTGIREKRRHALFLDFVGAASKVIFFRKNEYSVIARSEE
jgi:hypothetical protein